MGRGVSKAPHYLPLAAEGHESGENGVMENEAKSGPSQSVRRNGEDAQICQPWV